MCANNFWRWSPGGCTLLYDLFPWLTAGLRGCVYYWQHLTAVAVSLVHTLSSHRWSLRASQRNKCHPQIAATEKQATQRNTAHVVVNIYFISQELMFKHNRLRRKTMPTFLLAVCLMNVEDGEGLEGVLRTMAGLGMGDPGTRTEKES